MADDAVACGRSSAKVSKQSPVIDIHDKYCNKWCMAQVPQKIYKKDSHYTLNLRRQEARALQKYNDVDPDEGRR